MPTNLTASTIEALDGTLLASGQLCLTPVSTLTGIPSMFSAAGGGQVLARQVCFPVTAGSLGPAGVEVIDTLTATPSIGYLVRILDHQGVEISNIPCIQPTGAQWSLDDFVSNETLPILPPITISSGSTPPVGTCTAPSLYYENETAVWGCVAGTWVQIVGAEGPPGVAGQQGAEGPTGAAGEQGPPGQNSGPAGGDLSGTYPDPTVVAINGQVPGDIVTHNAAEFDLAGSAAAALVSATASSLQRASNLADLASAPAARAALGLGSAATVSQAAFDPAGAAAASQAAAEAFAANASNLSSGTILASLLPAIAESQVTGLTTDLAAREQTAHKGAPNGYAALDGAGLVPASQIPALAIDHTFVVSTQAAMLALAANIGDVAIRTDLTETFILQQSPATTLANWQQILTPAAPVQSVNGQVGNVSLASTNLTDSSALARLSSPVFIGAPKAPTAATSDSSTTLATTAFVAAQGASYDPAGASLAAQAAATASSLQRASNLSDLTSASTARTNLGLGSAATLPSSTFDPAGAASTAQASAISASEAFSSNASNLSSGTVAVTLLPLATPSTPGAVQPDGTTITVTAGVLTAIAAGSSGAVGGDLSGTLPNPTVAKISGATPGDIVTHNAADFQAAGTSLQMSANLSDLASVATARTNLGLGTAALQPSTAFDAAGAAASAITSAEAFSSNATNLTSGTVAAARIPTLNQSTTGNAATATNVPYTGLTGSVPTWNQSTTGNAANVTGIVAVVNGGTGSSTAAFSGANITALNATNISTGTLAAARLPSTLSGTSFSGNVSITGTLGVTGASTVASLAATSLTVSGLTTHSGQTNVTTAATSTLPFAIQNSTTAGCIQFSPSGSALTGSGWNTSIQSGDNVLLYTNSATAGSGVFNIVPFGTGGGLRMDGSGNTKITGNLTATGTVTAGGLTLNSSIVVGGSIIATTGAGSPQIEAESSVSGGWTLFYAAGTCPTGNNSIIQSSDSVLLFSNNGSSGTGTLALAPYLLSGGGGLRINNAGNVAITGTLTVSGTSAHTGAATFTNDLTLRHLIGGGTAPTIAIGGGAGTGATATITGTDTAGVITLTTGTSPGTQATMATLTFAVAYSVTPVFIFQATGGGGGYNAAALSGGSQVWVSPSTTGVVLNSGNVALAASTQYIWNYISVAP